MLITGVLVFLARMVDVSLNTVKMKAMMRGDKKQAASVAFVEVIIYTLAASKAFAYVDKPFILLMYATGYALGNFVGMTIDEKMSKGTMMLLVVKDKDEWDLAGELRADGFGVTTSTGYGLEGSEKEQLLVVVPKKKHQELKDKINKGNKSVYTAVIDVKEAYSMGMVSK